MFQQQTQDGNFRVGNLFNVEQATGVATLNAEAFNIAGLQELTLGEVTLGGNSASISDFPHRFHCLQLILIALYHTTSY